MGDGLTNDQSALSGPARRHHFGDNVVHFARILRAAGLPAGPERVLRALEALELVGVGRRDDVHAALSAVMIDRHEQQALFDAAFEAFWRDPKLLERLMYLALPKVSGRGQREDEAARARRLQEALSPRPAPASPPEAPQAEEQKFEAELTWSDRERLQQADFASMSTEEFEQAQRLARNLSLPLRPLPTRRRAPSLTGRPDLRRTMQRTLRAPDSLLPAYSAPRRRPPPLVLLVDISGSMERYTRLFLHFAHGLSQQQQQRVHTLVFGTRLTNITHCLRHRDPDLAMARADAMVQDWRGGTRIASNLRAFNRLWARRLLTGNAALILVTDGLDRDDAGDLGHEAALLSRFCHQMIWLNPLLRFEGFAPRAAGIRAIMPHVDQFLPMHNLASLADLGHELRSRHYKEIAT